ncbi:hypothetical protein [Colwellia sp. Arc7-D]|uniref:hypothetical protein n=1 Tax=Colwellia sp. Arc7-D TaxID=2161872 RepID=UPI000D38818E|nr:hypothetical protein [Colwellia sp. Arc7-D]AWB59385.1 hypothetical protein DBO93_18630 [Colwellia sp. Arc7-D]
MKNLPKLLIASYVVFISNMASAENLSVEIVQCSEMKNNQQRLQCFDSYVAKNSTLNSENKIDSTSKLEVSTINTKAEGEKELVSSFGKAHRYSEKEREFDEFKSTIKVASKNLHKDWEIELENGQIWLQKGGDKRAKFSDGDSIIITRGVMNSFQLKKIGTKRRIRVRRIL